jgi:hypothetical protein
MNVEIGTESAQFPEKGYQLQLQFSTGNLRRRRGKLVMNSFVVRLQTILQTSFKHVVLHMLNRYYTISLQPIGCN